MAAFAPPVHRDKFLYSSMLYADAGNDNHHPRASVAELTALLRPEAPKSKKTKALEVNEHAKDPPWHYWTAQLIHYGLTSTKDKNAAKIRLLSALNGNRLKVPGWIDRLEADLKKEWEAENRKLKKAAKAGGAPKPARTKEPTASVKASGTEHAPIEKKGAKQDPKKTPAKEASARNLAAPAAAPLTTPKPTTSKRKRDETEQSDAASLSKKAKSKSTTEKTIPSPAPTVTPAKPPASRKPPPAEEEPWPAPRRKIIDHDAWRFFDFDHLTHTRPPNAPHPRPYRVSCPDAEAEWDQDAIKDFYLAFSATEEEWWSRFEWGAFKGILILQRQPKRVNKAVGVPFKWRAHYAYGDEDGDGEGKIYFDSSDTIKGEFYNFFRERPCHFRGKAIQYAQASGHSYHPPGGTPVLDQMRMEWSQMPTVMRDAPAKKTKVKKDNLAESTSVSGRPGAVATDLGQDDVYLSGTYKISSDRIEEAFLIPTSNSPFRLTLFTEETTGIWWASFQWAMFDGVMKMDPGPTYETIDDMHTLGWRIRNTETGALTFGRNCTGEIRFDGKNRTLTGVLYDVPGVGGVDFGGKRIAGPRRVGGLKREWDWYVAEAYGRS